MSLHFFEQLSTGVLLLLDQPLSLYLLLWILLAQSAPVLQHYQSEHLLRKPMNFIVVASELKFISIILGFQLETTKNSVLVFIMEYELQYFLDTRAD